LAFDNVEVVVDCLFERAYFGLLIFKSCQFLEDIEDLGFLESFGLSNVAVMSLEAVFASP